MSLAVIAYFVFAIVSAVAAFFAYRRAFAFQKARDELNANDQFGAGIALTILAMVLLAMTIH